MNTGAAGNRIDQDKQYRNPLVWRSRQHIADPRKRPNERCIDNKNYFRDEIHFRLGRYPYICDHDEQRPAVRYAFHDATIVAKTLKTQGARQEQ